MAKYHRLTVEFAYETEDELMDITERIIDSVCGDEHGPDDECKRSFTAWGEDVTEEVRRDEVREFMGMITFKDWPDEDRYHAG